MEARLPSDKLVKILETLAEFHHKKKCTKREMLSLVGRLSFACKVVPAGRFFLRRLIDTAHKVQNLNYHIYLNADTHADLRWWEEFLTTWNGKSLFLESTWSSPEVTHLYTDAAGSIGYGAYYDGRWFNGSWPSELRSFSIVWKELFPIFLACTIWGQFWQKKRICFHCDNQAVVEIWRKGSTKDQAVMALVRKTFLAAARNNFTLRISHIPGTNNIIADSLSRLQVQRFRQLAPQAETQAEILPPVLPLVL